MSGHCDLLSLALPEDDMLRNDIEQIKKAAGNAANLTRQLLAFSRKQVMSVGVVDLNAVITNLLKM